jgi:F420-non-reducing hydrogenase iron-sulfur subunit
MKGNLHSRALVAYLHEVLEAIGIEKERLQMMFVSAAEGERFRQLAVEMDATIRKLGPSKLRLYQIQAKAAPKKTSKAK